MVTIIIGMLVLGRSSNCLSQRRKGAKRVFEEGVCFQILKAGSSGWQKGKLRINVTLEFIPDEPEENKSPLDDVRQEIDSGDR